MLRPILLAIGLAAGLASPASAQVADVVTSCGVASGVNTATGQGGHLVRDVNGNLCTSSAPLANSAAGNAVAPTGGTNSTAYVAKASGANLYGFSATMGATAGFLALLNTATAPSASAAITPLECIAVPANGYVARRQDIPDRYGTGLTVVVSSSCTTYTAVTPAVTSVLVQ